jgi:Uncharacterized small protein
MADRLEKGDLVKLKSGGPRMTVDNIAQSGVYCTWFDATGRQEACFSSEALKKVEEEE